MYCFGLVLVCMCRVLLLRFGVKNNLLVCMVLLGIFVIGKRYLNLFFLFFSNFNGILVLLLVLLRSILKCFFKIICLIVLFLVEM